MDLPFSTEDLTQLYRFALLLTGDDGAAQQVLHDACLDCGARLASYRNEESRLACMLGTMRHKAQHAQGRPAEAEGPAGTDAPGIARAFATLPEEERVALAGLYSGLLSAGELAEALRLSLEQLGAVLKRARERLARSGLELGKQSLEQAM